MPFPIRALLAGRVQPLSRGEQSAIAKHPLSGPVQIGLFGIMGDEHADQVRHGGRDKALHHYPFDHYARWKEDAPDTDFLRAAGAFGENISTTGLDENTVCIGDRFRLGSALVEVSQARQPCWKQGDRLAWAALPDLMVREGRSGWYYRVLEPGQVQAGDDLVLIDRPFPDWTARRVFDLLVGGKYKEDREALAVLSEMDVLFEGWRVRARQFLNG
jgi:MOSC domain-containing protein YiiM